MKLKDNTNTDALPRQTKHANGYANGHVANGHVANGHVANSHVANGHVANGHAKMPSSNGTLRMPPPKQRPITDGNTTLDWPDESTRSKVPETHETFEETPLWVAITTYIGFIVLIIFGHFRNFLVMMGIEKLGAAQEPRLKGWVPLLQSFETFWTHHMYRRVRDIFNRPIATCPGPYFDLIDRVSDDCGWTFRNTGSKTRVLNFGSYNYLGYAENAGYCAGESERATQHYSVGTASSRHEMGNLRIYHQLEKLVSTFVGQEDAITFGMGFATNSMNIPTLVNKDSVILSDELNHASLVLGCRLSGAKIVVFKHNNTKDLEEKLRSAVLKGQPLKNRPWKKIMIVVEGLYSMEGSMINLPELIALKKKYKAYLYLDEAHSIGALGPQGRGVVDFWGCNPRDVDIMMGTFSKSFGAVGGYIAGSKKIINYLRLRSHSNAYATSMSPPVAQQVLAATTQIMGLDGTKEGKERVRTLAWNCRYFRTRLHQMGFILYGSIDSPVVPILIYQFDATVAFSRECLARGLGTVVVGFPATSLLTGRARLCLSAAHTKDIMDKTLAILDEVGDLLSIKYSKRPPPPVNENSEDFLARYHLQRTNTGKKEKDEKWGDQ